jgi:hypothetical protein
VGHQRAAEQDRQDDYVIALSVWLEPGSQFNARSS